MVRYRAGKTSQQSLSGNPSQKPAGAFDGIKAEEEAQEIAERLVKQEAAAHE